MQANSGQPDPSLYINQLHNEDAFHREAAAWTLGELGNLRAARPLAGALLREVQCVDQSGFLDQDRSDVVCAVAEAIGRIGAKEALYALVKSLCVLTRAQDLDETTVVQIVDTIGEVGGPNAMREAADRVERTARTNGQQQPGIRVVGRVLLHRLSLCGDAAITTLRRLAHGGPLALRPIARRVYATV